MDPGERLNAGRLAAREHRYEEALEHYVWFHEHALEHDEAYYGVRLSFALASWSRLAEIYPPAAEALKRIRDGKTKMLLDGKGDARLFDDVAAINENLHEPEATSRLFEELSTKFPPLAKQCSHVAMSALVETKAYELARVFVDNAEDMLRGWTDRLNEQIAALERKPETRAPVREAYTRIYCEDVRNLLQIFIGTGEIREAARVRQLAFAAVAASDIRQAVQQALSDLPLS